MRSKRFLGGNRGYSLIEVVIVMAVMVVVGASFSVFIRNFVNHSAMYQDHVFAMEKAMQMLEELRAVVGSGESGQSLSVLDNYDDQGAYRYILTTHQALTDVTSGTVTAYRPDEYLVAGDLASGNRLKPGKGWLYVRNVSVKKVANDPKVRKVYVRVYYAAPNSGTAAVTLGAPANPKLAPLAEVFGYIQTSGSQQPPTQVMDYYFIAIENVPGWWTRLDSLQALMQDALVSVQARNAGLTIRPHWIRRLSFGRDLEYTPELNTAADAGTAGAFDKAYVYPGLVTYDSTLPSPPYYYSPSWFLGRVNTDGHIANPTSYAMADQFNHAMRYRDEMNLYNLLSVVNPAVVPEVSLRMLMEALNNPQDPNFPAFRNSIIINLHGEMVPVPPIRNISDAAKDPVEFPGKAFRAVTHPEKLQFDFAEQPALRVYAYQAVTFGATSTKPYPAAALPETGNTITVSVFIPGLTLANLDQLNSVQGSSTVPYRWNMNTVTVTATAIGAAVSGPGFIADNFYSTSTARAGLRIRLYGVTTTAHEYRGAP